MSANNLQVKDLNVTAHSALTGERTIIHHLSTAFRAQKITGLVGESGSGKSMTMKALMGLLPAQITADMAALNFAGQNIEKPSPQLPMSMIFQDPLSSLNPLRTVAYHLREVIARWHQLDAEQTEDLMQNILRDVGLKPEQVEKQFPHELSGGMQQRIMIALALLKSPKLLIADEPTTALDVTIQKQILDLIQRQQQERAMSVILVTHDFAVISEICDEVKVMYQGVLLEEGRVEEIFENPQHTYTKNLLKAIPTGKNRERLFQMPKLTIAPPKEDRALKAISATHFVREED